MDQFLKNQKLLKLIQDKKANLNIPVTAVEVKLVV